MTNLSASYHVFRIILETQNTGKTTTNVVKKRISKQNSPYSNGTTSHIEKLKHTIYDCVPCEILLVNYSTLHKSTTESTEKMVKKKTNELVNEMTHNNSYGAEQLLNLLDPVMKKSLKTDLKSSVSKKFNLTEKVSSEQKRKHKIQITRESTKTIEQLIGKNENEVQNFLASGKSYSQVERDRLSTFFEASNTAKKRINETSEKFLTGKKNPKTHTDTIENYHFDKEDFLNFIRNLAPGSKVIWRYLAFKFHVKNKNGITPKNAGQVLQKYAEQNGVNVNQFNTSERVSGRDFLQRVRRARLKVSKKVSIPTPRPARALRKKIQRKLGSKELYIEERIAPKVIRTNKIHENGKLIDKEVAVYGRMIPILNILEAMQIHHRDYERTTPTDTLTQDDLRKIFLQLAEEMPDSEEKAKEKLQKMEKTRHLKIWHDHSEILNHSYFTVMISTLYGKAAFITNEEYLKIFPERPPVDVQGKVERPYLYIIGQSSSSDIDQLSYMQTRIKDIQNLRQQNDKILFILRIFS